MAVDRQTNQALSVLNNILGNQQASRENEKNRALQVMQLKIQSDERDLDRIDRRLSRLQEEVFQMDKDFVKMTGAKKKLSELSGLKTDAGSLIGDEINRLATDKQGMLAQIGELGKQRQQMLDTASEFYSGYNEANSLFEKFRNLSGSKDIGEASIVDPGEFSALKSYLKDQGEELSDAAIVGMRKKFEELSDPTMNRLGKDRDFDEGVRRFEIGSAFDEKRFKADNDYRNNQLKFQAQKLKHENLKMRLKNSPNSKENMDALRKDTVDSYRQLKSKLEDYNREHEISTGGLFLPDIDGSAENMVEAQNAIADSFADFASKFNDSDLPDKVEALISEHSAARASGDIDKQYRAANAIMQEVMKDPSSVIGQLDYSNWPLAKEDAASAQYGTSLFRAYEIVSAYQDKVLQSSLKLTPEQVATKEDMAGMIGIEDLDGSPGAVAKRFKNLVDFYGLGSKRMPALMAPAHHDMLNPRTKNVKETREARQILSRIAKGSSTKKDSDQLKKLLQIIKGG